jgi:hypothetical protein
VVLVLCGYLFSYRNLDVTDAPNPLQTRSRTDKEQVSTFDLLMVLNIAVIVVVDARLVGIRARTVFERHCKPRTMIGNVSFNIGHRLPYPSTGRALATSKACMGLRTTSNASTKYIGVLAFLSSMLLKGPANIDWGLMLQNGCTTT